MISQKKIDKDYIITNFAVLTDDKVIYKVSEWAEEKRYLPPELSPIPGYYDNANNAPMVEIMDCMSENSPVREVALKKGAQVGWTTAVLENFLGYIIDYCPGPTMFVTATKAMAEQAVELRIDRMIQGAGLADKIFAQNAQSDSYNRKTGNTKSKKEFPGGFILPVGSNSPNSLRMTSVKYLLFDEIDASLDKRNSERLASLLRKYIGAGQYILITHNDALITDSKVLYGVSMHEGISKILSLRLD